MFRILMSVALLLVAGGARALTCGDTVGSIGVLTEDLHCTTGSYALFMPNSARLYLNGHTISGPPDMVGILVADRFHHGIYSGTIRGFKIGISGSDTKGVAIRGVTFAALHIGISLEESCENDITSSTFVDIGDTAIRLIDGFRVACEYRHNVIDDNRFDNVGTGIELCGLTLVGGYITNNRMFGTRNNAIRARGGSGLNFIRSNEFYDTADPAILLQASNNNRINGNTFAGGKIALAFQPEFGDCKGGSPSVAPVKYNLVEDNTIIEYGTGLTLGSGASSAALVVGNVIRSNQILDSDFGIVFRPDAHGNDARGNDYTGTTTPIIDLGRYNRH